MSAFFIATISVKNPEKFTQYASQVGETFKPFGGALMTRGKVERVLAGDCNHDAAGVIKFDTIENLNNWYDSDAYQALIPLRNEGADVSIVAYVVPE